MRNLIWLIIILFLKSNTVFAMELEQIQNNEVLDEYINLYNFEDLDGVINKGNSSINFSIEEIIKNVVLGNIDFNLSSIANLILNLLLSEIYAHKYILRNLIFIAICSAFLKALTDSFKFNSVGKLGFYTMYIVIIFFLMSSFQFIYFNAEQLIYDLSEFIIGSIPLILGSLLLSGNTNTAIATQPIFLTLSYILMNFVKNVLLPFIYLIFIAEIFNNLSDKQILKGFIETAKKVIKFLIKLMLYIFLGVVSIFRIASPVSDGLIKKTFQSTINFIPIVGNSLANAVDTVYYFSDAIKSGLSVALILGVLMLSSIYIFKLFALQIVYYYVSVVVEPICDKKIINAFNCLKSHIYFILAITTTVIFMFIVSIMLMLTV